MSLIWFLCRDALRKYEELSEIFSDKDNYSQTRELLKEVGGAACLHVKTGSGAE